jgi:hypothetical protein
MGKIKASWMPYISRKKGRDFCVGAFKLLIAIKEALTKPSHDHWSPDAAKCLRLLGHGNRDLSELH